MRSVSCSSFRSTNGNRERSTAARAAGVVQRLVGEVNMPPYRRMDAVHSRSATLKPGSAA